MAKETLDRIDLKLLHALQSNAALAMHAAADRVGLSIAACYKRVQRLKRSRYIAGEVAVVSPKTMGWPLVMVVLVTIESGQSARLDDIIRRLSALPEIIEFHYVTGDYDLVLKVVAEDMEAYERFLLLQLMSVGNIKDVKTLVSLRTVKDRSAIPPAPRLLAEAG